MQLTGLFVHKQGDGYPPGTLTRDTPVGALPQHGIDARPSPVRNPTYAINSLLCVGKQAPLRHANKPLGCRTENNGRFVAPTMRITVFVGLVRQQPSPGL